MNFFCRSGPVALFLFFWPAISSADFLDLPAYYEHTEQALVAHPVLNSRELSYIIEYARQQGELSGLKNRWETKAKKSPEQTGSYSILLGRLALASDEPQEAKKQFQRGGDSVYSHHARAKWEVLHGTSEAALQHLQAAQAQALSPSQWVSLTEALAVHAFNENDRERCLSIWLEAWDKKSAIAYRTALVEPLCAWFNYLGAMERFEEKLLASEDGWARTLYLADYERLSSRFGKAEEQLATLAETDRERSEALLLEKRLATDLGADMESAHLALKLAWKNEALPRSVISGVFQFEGYSSAVVTAIPSRMMGQQRTHAGAFLNAHSEFLTQDPMLALRYGKKQPHAHRIIHSHAQQHPNDLEALLVSLELASQGLRQNIADPAPLRTELINGYKRLYREIDRQAHPTRRGAQRSSDSPALPTDDFWSPAMPQGFATGKRFSALLPDDSDLASLAQNSTRPTRWTPEWMMNAANFRWIALGRLARLEDPDHVLSFFHEELAKQSDAVTERLLGYLFLNEPLRFLEALSEHGNDPAVLKSHQTRLFLQYASQVLPHQRLSSSVQTGVIRALENLHRSIVERHPSERYVSAGLLIDAFTRGGYTSNANRVFEAESAWARQQSNALARVGFLAFTQGREFKSPALQAPIAADAEVDVLESQWHRFLHRPQTIPTANQQWWHGGRLEDRLTVSLSGRRLPTSNAFDLSWSQSFTSALRLREQDPERLVSLRDLTRSMPGLTPLQRYRGELYLLFLQGRGLEPESLEEALAELEQRYPLQHFEIHHAKIAVGIETRRFDQILTLLDAPFSERGPQSVYLELMRLHLLLHFGRHEEVSGQVRELLPRLRRTQIRSLGEALQSVDSLKALGKQLVLQAGEIERHVREPFEPPHPADDQTAPPEVDRRLMAFWIALDLGYFTKAAELAETARTSVQPTLVMSIQETLQVFAQERAPDSYPPAGDHPAMSFPLSFNRVILDYVPRLPVYQKARFPYYWALYQRAPHQLLFDDWRQFLLSSPTNMPSRDAVINAMIESHPDETLMFSPSLLTERFDSNNLDTYVEAASKAVLNSQNTKLVENLSKFYLLLGERLLESQRPDEASFLWQRFLDALLPERPGMRPIPARGLASKGRPGAQIERQLTELYQQLNRKRQLVSLKVGHLLVPQWYVPYSRRDGHRVDLRSHSWRWQSPGECQATQLIDTLAHEELLEELVALTREKLATAPQDTFLVDLHLFASVRTGSPDFLNALEQRLTTFPVRDPGWHLAMLRAVSSSPFASEDLTLSLLNHAEAVVSHRTEHWIANELRQIKLASPRIEITREDWLALFEDTLAILKHSNPPRQHLEQTVAAIEQLLVANQNDLAENLWRSLASDALREGQDNTFFPLFFHDACIALLRQPIAHQQESLTDQVIEGMLKNLETLLENAMPPSRVPVDLVSTAIAALLRADATEKVPGLLEFIKEKRLHHLERMAGIFDEYETYRDLQAGDSSRSQPIVWLYSSPSGPKVAWGWGRHGTSRATPNANIDLRHFETYPARNGEPLQLSVLAGSEEGGTMNTLVEFRQPFEEALVFNQENFAPGTQYLRALARTTSAQGTEAISVGPTVLASSTTPHVPPMWRAQNAQRTHPSSSSTNDIPVTTTSINERIGGVLIPIQRLTTGSTRPPIEFFSDATPLTPGADVLFQCVARTPQGVCEPLLRFLDKDHQVVSNLKHPRPSSMSPFASWIVQQWRVPIREIPPQAVSVQVSLQLASSLRHFTKERMALDIANVSLWQEPARSFPQYERIQLLPGAIQIATSSSSRDLGAALLRDHSLHVISLTGDVLASRKFPSSQAGRVYAIHFAGPTPDAPLLIHAGQNLYCWKWAEGNNDALTPLPGVKPRKFTVSPDGEKLAHFSAEGALTVYELSSRSPVWTLSGIPPNTPIQFSSDGKHLYAQTRSREGQTPRVFLSTDGTELPLADVVTFFQEHADDPSTIRWHEANTAPLGSVIPLAKPDRIELLEGSTGNLIDILTVSLLPRIKHTWTDHTGNTVYFFTTSGAFYRWQRRG